MDCKSNADILLQLLRLHLREVAFCKPSLRGRNARVCIGNCPRVPMIQLMSELS
jgi:hypothetical protein